MKPFLCAVFVLLLASPALAAKPDKPIVLKDFGSFHIGGERVTLSGLPVTEVQAVPGSPPRKSDPNGDYQVGQMYVQYMLLAKPKSPYPLLFWHGGGMTGVNWETKPDGAPGWQQFFVRAGFDTYVSDAVERGRSSWPRYPEIAKSAPEHRTQNMAWDMFRVGPPDGYASDPDKRVAFPGVRFPVAYFDQFWKQTVARWTDSDKPVQTAYDQLLHKLGPAILIAHSQGGVFALNAAVSEPETLKALVLLEPSSGPDPAKVDVSRMKGVPILVVWSDFYDKSPRWQMYRANVTRCLDAVVKAGGSVTVIDLPAQGIRGNEHMLMLDDNSDQIAGMVLDWLRAKRLVH